MRGAVMYAAGDVRIENIPDAGIREPTDALVRVTRACICGSDLWPYNLKKPGGPAQRMGHEAIGIVEAVGSDVRTLKVGNVVVMPFASSDGTCTFCQEGLHTPSTSTSTGSPSWSERRGVGGCHRRPSPASNSEENAHAR
jgi:threonine dehydrogenase-like Zn-dependent dehydrogenase